MSSAAVALVLTYGTAIELIPGATAQASDGFRITLTGYGHKITRGEGDLGFLELELKLDGETETVRFFAPGTTPPSLQPKPIAWKGRQITLKTYGDHGPPHDDKSKSSFVVTKVP